MILGDLSTDKLYNTLFFTHLASSRMINTKGWASLRSVHGTHHVSIWHGLPPEVLSLVFIWGFRERQPVLNPTSTDYPDYAELYSILLVCRYWYSTGVACSQLWDFVSSSYPPQLARLLLKRSRQTPIRVQPVGSSNHLQVQNLETLHLILQESRRIQYIHIMITSDVATLLKGLSIPLPLPVAKTLSVDKRVSHNWSGGQVDEELISLKFPFHPPPYLCRLHISGYTLSDIKHLLQSRIQNISLLLYDETTDGEYDDSPPINEILYLMKEMPLLEEVDIPTWLDNSAQPSLCPPNMVFQNLRLLKMQLNLPDASFLRHMTFAPGIRLHISTQCHLLDGEAFNRVFGPTVVACGLATPESSTSQIHLPQVDSFNLHQSPHWTYTVKCWLTGIPNPKMKGNPLHGSDFENSPVLELDFEYHVGIKITEIFSAVPQCIEISSIRRFNLALAPESDPGMVEEVCRIIQRSYRMPQLHTVVASQWSLSFLYQMIWGENEPSNEEIRFPLLRSIWTPHLPPITAEEWALFESILDKESIEVFYVWREDFDDQSSQEQIESLQSRFSALIIDDEKLFDFNYTWYERVGAINR